MSEWNNHPIYTIQVKKKINWYKSESDLYQFTASMMFQIFSGIILGILILLLTFSVSAPNN